MHTNQTNKTLTGAPEIARTFFQYILTFAGSRVDPPSETS
jgi:hypothetical protein